MQEQYVDYLPGTQPTASKHWQQQELANLEWIKIILKKYSTSHSDFVPTYVPGSQMLSMCLQKKLKNMLYVCKINTANDYY